MKRVRVALAVLLFAVAATVSGCLVPYPDEDEHGGRDGYYNHEQYREEEHHRHDEHHDEGAGGYRHDERRWEDEEHN